nr:unnamed protein product [Callosobruchus chinensis]
MLMFGIYSVINIVVLLNLLIAMMNHSYQLISERADVEWKLQEANLDQLLRRRYCTSTIQHHSNAKKSLVHYTMGPEEILWTFQSS